MYIDFHNHLDFYKKDFIYEAINDINKNNIKTVACSMDLNSYNKNIELVKDSKFIIPTFGVHPSRTFEFIDKIDELEEFVKKTPIIGEVGLDFYWVEDKNTYKSQIQIFEKFLKYANKYNKYINIHTKGAEELVLELIKKYNLSEQSIIHWYSGDKNTLNKLIDAKCYFTASVDLPYSEKSREIAKSIPIAKLLGETDGPTALEWINGEYGMPSEIINVYKHICEIKNIDINEYKLNCKNTLTKMIKEYI